MKYLFYFLFFFSLSDIYAQNDSFDIECYSKMVQNFNSPDSVIVRLCKFRDHLFKSIGTLDNKGRYSYYFELFKLEKRDTLRIDNLSFFNEKRLELEGLLNSRLKSEFESDSQIPELQDCLNEVDFRYFNLNEFGISFSDDNHIKFTIYYGLGSACFNVNSGMVLLPLREVEKYLK